MVRTSHAVNTLRAAIEDPSGLSDRLVDRLRLAHDASHFLLHPAAVATPTTVEQVRDLMHATARAGGVLTFRVASLYPLLYRLEKRGWIEGRWSEKAGERRRRLYKLTREGRRILAAQRSGWEKFVRAINQITRREHA